MIDEIRATSLLSAKVMLNVNDVSVLTGWKPSYVRKLAEDGVLPYYKPLGKQLFFHKDDINSLLMRNRIPSVAELIGEVENNKNI